MLFVRLEQLRLQDSKLSDWKLSNRFFMCTKFLNSNKDKELYCIIGKIDLKKLGCILNPGHGKILAPDFNFYIQKDKYPI